MTKTLDVRFDGKVFVPEEAADLPVGTKAQVVLDTAPRKFQTVAEAMEALAGTITDEQADAMLAALAEQRQIEPDVADKFK